MGPVDQVSLESHSVNKKTNRPKIRESSFSSSDFLNYLSFNFCGATMTSINNALHGLSLDGRTSKDLVCLEDYVIFPKPSAKQKLSPLDMNMPRIYGTRWILCFPLPAGADGSNV